MCSPGARSIVTSCWPPREFVRLIVESGTVKVCVVASWLVKVIVSHRETDRCAGSKEKCTCFTVATEFPPSGHGLAGAVVSWPSVVPGGVLGSLPPPPPPHAADTRPSASTPAAAARLQPFPMAPVLSTGPRDSTTRSTDRSAGRLAIRRSHGLPETIWMSDPGATVIAEELAEGADRGDRARRAFRACRAQRGLEGPGAAGGASPAPHGLSGGPRPHRAHEVLPPPQAQDPGVPGTGGGPLPGPAHPHPGGGPDRPDGRAGPGPQRGPHRGHRPGPRPGAHAVRPSRRGGPVAVPGPAVPAQRAEPPGGGPPGGRRARPEPHLGGPRRHREPHLDHAHAGHARGPGGPVRRPHRLREPRHRRRHPGRGPHGRRAPSGGGGPRGGQPRRCGDPAVLPRGRGAGRPPLVHVRPRLPPGRGRGRAAKGGGGDPGPVRVLP